MIFHYLQGLPMSLEVLAASCWYGYRNSLLVSLKMNMNCQSGGDESDQTWRPVLFEVSPAALALKCQA
jgi:hypothetical protein